MNEMFLKQTVFTAAVMCSQVTERQIMTTEPGYKVFLKTM